MQIDIVTLFPALCKGVLSESVIGRAWKEGIDPWNSEKGEM